MKTFGERFGESRGEPFEFAGKLVHAILEREVESGTKLQIVFHRFNPSVPQALDTVLEKGHLLIANQKFKKGAILWTETAPRVVEVVCITKLARTTFKAWNAWKDEDGITMAWIGNGGMLIEEREGVTVLKCSDGVGEPQFDDLVVEISGFGHRERSGIK